MNKNTKKTHLANDNTSFLRSVSKETKEHFDSLLKIALHKNDKLQKETNNQNRSKKLLRPKTVEDETKIDDGINKEFDIKECPTKKNFILEKFLSDAVNSKKESNDPSPRQNILISSATFIKHSISPRKSKTKDIGQDEDQEDDNVDQENKDIYHDSEDVYHDNKDVDHDKENVGDKDEASNIDDQPARPFSKQRTYSISSPVLYNPEILKDFDKLSTCSKNTYDVTDPKVAIGSKIDDDNQSNNSRGTYNIYKPDDKKRNSIHSISSNESEDVGTIVIHYNSPKSKSAVKVVSKIKRKDSTSTDNASRQSTRSSKLQYENEKSKKEDEKSRKDKSEKDRDSSEYEQTAKDLVQKQSEVGSEKLNTTIKSKELSVKKVKRHKQRAKDIASNDEASLKDSLYTYQELIGVIVYKTDKLQLNSLINHPCVKIHVIDSETGEYLRRSKEINGEDGLSQSIKYIYPLITKSYELQQNRSLIPYWEELVVFNEDFKYLLDYKDSIIIFFEILDFLSFSDASSKYRREGSSSGWHKVAWAFLKLVSNTGQLNINEKIRLQLYKPKKTVFKKSVTECDLFDWWKKGVLIKYPSTLHISIKNIRADTLKETKHSDAVFKSQLGLDIFHKDTKEEMEPKTVPKEYLQKIKWSRMPNQSCKIPNKVHTILKSASKGCFAVKFSNNGLWVACGVADETKYGIIIYSVFDKQINLQREYCKFAGHQGIIYNLIWTSDDKYLISSSADCTTYIWSVYEKHYYPKQVLPHPSFVYCALLNEDFLHIATGCYDQVLRIWVSTGIESDFELLQELDGHLGYITSLCFGENKHMLYSADSVGMIKEWNFNITEWKLNRTLKFQELHRTIINNIILHPGGKRMIVFCRDSTHRMIDLVVGCIIQWYRGILNFRVHTNGCLSPCGNLIFAPSEDGAIFVWNTDTGTLLTTYNPYSKYSKETIVSHCIHYHPFEHSIAISHYGSPLPILLLTNFGTTGADSELKMKNCTKVSEMHSPQQKKPKSPRKDVKEKQKNPSLKKFKKTDNNLSFNVIIDKIDDVLVSAKSN